MKQQLWHTGTGGAELIIYREDGFAVADAKTHHGKISREEAEQHARLIASAPSLLAACKAALKEEHKFSVRLSDELRAAINLAEGATQ